MSETGDSGQYILINKKYLMISCAAAQVFNIQPIYLDQPIPTMSACAGNNTVWTVW